MKLQRAAGALTAAAAALSLSACAPAVLLRAAPYAADPICGQILLALRGDRFSFPERPVTAQSTMAWGTEDAAIVLRCGVEPPAPTTDRCLGVTSSDGTEIDWINPENDSELIPSHADLEIGSWTFITYGRAPAVEIVVPAALQIEPADVLQGVSLAVSQAPAFSECVSLTEVG